MLGAQTGTCRLPSSLGLCPKSWREPENDDHVHCDVLFVVLQVVLIIELLPTQAILSVASTTCLLNGWMVILVGYFFAWDLFSRFSRVEPFTKIKTAKFLLSMCKANEPHFNPSYLELSI